jgi:tetratricopeptide (TPR) repeat protein
MTFSRFTIDRSTPSLWRVTFDHPPINLIDHVMIGELGEPTSSPSSTRFSYRQTKGFPRRWTHTGREPVTTAGVIAIGNLDARIGGQLPRSTLTVGERVELVELIALRGYVLGRIADLEQAAALAGELASQVPSDPLSVVARARMRGVFHRFGSALTDLDTAAALGGDRVELDNERAAIYQALGRYDQALAIRRPAVDRQADFSALAALASVYSERGEADEAERWFDAASRSYRGTSPFPLAMLEFQRGQLWLVRDDLRRARRWCDAAVWRIPAYVPAQGHLAEIEAALGETAAAIARLRPLASASDDPDYATQLARILGAAGHTEEAQGWRGKAEARYDELLARHPDAFADHAAEFWLEVGGDPDRALRLAQQNLSLRQTPRARALVRRASGHVPG